MLSEICTNFKHAFCCGRCVNIIDDEIKAESITEILNINTKNSREILNQIQSLDDLMKTISINGIKYKKAPSLKIAKRLNKTRISNINKKKHKMYYNKYEIKKMIRRKQSIYNKIKQSKIICEPESKIFENYVYHQNNNNSIDIEVIQVVNELLIAVCELNDHGHKQVDENISSNFSNTISLQDFDFDFIQEVKITSSSHSESTIQSFDEKLHNNVNSNKTSDDTRSSSITILSDIIDELVNEAVECVQVFEESEISSSLTCTTEYSNQNINQNLETNECRISEKTSENLSNHNDPDVLESSSNEYVNFMEYKPI